MNDLAARLSESISDWELERRWSAARKVMLEANADALIVQGANHIAGVNGYFQWFTARVVLGSYPETVILPKSGLMTLIGHGPAGADADLAGKDVSARGVGPRLNTAAFPMASYTGKLDAEAAANAINKMGARRVGLVGPNSMYYEFLAALKRLAGSVDFVDVSNEVDLLRARKSDEEIGFLRKTARMQDEIIEGLRSYIRPGLRDFEIMAYGDYLGKQRGSQTGYFLGSSAPPGEPTGMRMHPQHNRVMRKGDVILVQAENSGPGGYFVHMCRYFVLGKTPKDLVDAFGKVVEAQGYTARLLRPGVAFRDAFADYNGYMRKNGLPEERRLHCHSQGYDVVERPLARSEEMMLVENDMNIGIHPSISNERVFATISDNFLTRADGSLERLHKTPQEIFEI